MSKDLPAPISDSSLGLGYKISEEPWYRKNVLKWVSYDLGNTIYSMVVVSLTITPLLYILYFEQLGNGDDAVNAGNFALSLVLLIGNLIMAIISPFLGAYADQKERRVPLLMQLSVLCITFMAALLASAYTNSIVTILFIFLFANLFYQMGLVVYDSMLPFITDKEFIGRIGGLGVAIGYFGSFIGIGLGFVLTLGFGFEDWAAAAADPNAEDPAARIDNFNMGYIPYIFPLAAFMFLLFALPMITVKEKDREEAPKPTGKLFSDVVDNVKVTAGEVFSNRDFAFFLIGWLIYVDAANTMIAFMSVMVSNGLGFGEGSTTLIVLAIGIASAVIFTYPVGIFVDKFGPKRGLLLTTVLWLLAITIAFFTNLNFGGFTTPKWPVYIFPIIVGPALGGGWVVQRQFITELSPPAKVGNYFGFSNIFGRISAAIGPYIFSFTIFMFTDGFGFASGFATRLATLTLAIIMIIGFFVIWQVRDVHKEYLNGARAIGDGSFVNENGAEVIPRR